MLITDVVLMIFTWPDAPAIAYSSNNPRARSESRIGLVSVETDAGITGHCFLGSSFRGVDVDAVAVLDYLKPALVGENPLDRELLHRRMMACTRAVMLRPIGALDVALWDIAGKAAGLAIHRLLGTWRERVPAYASSPTMNDVGEYVEQALRVKELGYAGYKIHPPHNPALHIPLCEAVRRAVGDNYKLMLDASGTLQYSQALRLGRTLEQLRFHWYEDPLPADDIYNNAKLCADLRIPVIATEYAPGGFHSYAAWITARATDALRGDVAVKGGITAAVKTAHLADAFRMNYEIHHGGNSLNNVANLHVAAAIPNCEFFEVLLPDEAQKYGLVHDLDVDGEGFVRVPDGPGLGVEIDFDLIRSRTVEVLR